jgi:coproporphyrinogen III oxidase-like Fe-S oxidoreductase
MFSPSPAGAAFRRYLDSLTLHHHQPVMRQRRQQFQVLSKIRLLIRNICMCFDAYLRQKARMQQFSRVI